MSNHLPREDLEDIVLYCKYHCLLAMSAEQRVGQLVVWREVRGITSYQYAGYTASHKVSSRINSSETWSLVHCFYS